MRWTPGEKEIAAILSLEAQKRYEHWVKKSGACGLVAVFPSPADKSVAVEPRRLESDLREELSKYE